MKDNSCLTQTLNVESIHNNEDDKITLKIGYSNLNLTTEINTKCHSSRYNSNEKIVQIFWNSRSSALLNVHNSNVSHIFQNILWFSNSLCLSCGFSLYAQNESMKCACIEQWWEFVQFESFSKKLVVYNGHKQSVCHILNQPSRLHWMHSNHQCRS